MASKEINDFTVKATVTASDEYLLQETSGGTTKKTLVSTIRDYILGYVTSLSSKASVVSADELLINDSADSNAPKKVTVGTFGLVPSGVTLPFMGSGSVPAGYLLCDGTAISRTTYSGLFTAISTLYGVGDGSTTFNLPDLAGKYLQGYDSGVSEAIGTSQGSSAPNITGSMNSYIRGAPAGEYLDLFKDATGALDKVAHDGTGAGSGTNSDTSLGYGVTIDASKSSSVYQTTTRIQTDNYACQYIIKT